MSRASYILIHQTRAGTAFPPVRGGAPTMEEWARLRAARRPWWKRLFSFPRAASPAPYGARPSHIEVVEAGFDNGETSRA